MSDFVKGIVKLARKYRASEADALLIRNHDHIITASCSAYGKLKNLILEKKSELKADINKYGLEKLKGSGYVIHHFGETSHFLEVGRSYADYKKMIEILSNDQLSKMKFDKGKIQNYPTKTPLEVVGGDAQLYHVLQNEIQHIMFIPEWYHNYLHKHHQLNLTDKDNIYQYLQDNLKNDYLFQHVKTLQFKKGTVIDAAKSIYNLVSIAKIENKDDIIDILHACYIELRNKIQDKPNSQQKYTSHRQSRLS